MDQTARAAAVFTVAGRDTMLTKIGVVCDSRAWEVSLHLLCSKTNIFVQTAPSCGAMGQDSAKEESWCVVDRK